MYDQLRLILKRILPLRKSDGGKDILVMLGDYIDRRQDSHKVVDLLIEIKKRYKDQVVLLQGNHEELIIDAIKPCDNSMDYLMWMDNGGELSLKGYLERAGEDVDNPYIIKRQRVKSYIPKAHIEFFQSLPKYFEIDDFIFVHAGCDPTVHLDKQNPEPFLWDRSLAKIVAERLCKVPLPWEKVVVTGHNGRKSGKIIVRDKFLMLDTSYLGDLLIVEMRSRKGFVAKKGKKRLVGVDFAN
jgi:serine/threonine protein phosphatase 1